MERLPTVLSPSIAAADLCHQVKIQAPQNTADARGMSVSPATWNTICTARAAIYTAGGRETSQASQIVSEVSHVVKMRWINIAILAGYQLLFKDRVFIVKYVENILERNRVLVLYCLEADQGGGQL
jgi:head-tail adaptor